MAKASKGKYEDVLPGLPKFQEESSYQEKINKVKATIIATEGQDAVVLATGFGEARDVKEGLEEDLYLINMKIAAYEQLLDDSQTRQAAGWGDYGVKDNAVRLVDGGMIRVQREPYGVVKDKEAFRLWCIGNGYERQLQLWPSTMNALCKERLLEGEAEPDGCEVFTKTKVVYIKGDGGE